MSVGQAQENLAVWLDRFYKDNVGKPTPPVVVAAQHLFDEVVRAGAE